MSERPSSLSNIAAYFAFVHGPRFATSIRPTWSDELLVSLLRGRRRSCFSHLLFDQLFTWPTDQPRLAIRTLRTLSIPFAPILAFRQTVFYYSRHSIECRPSRNHHSCDWYLIPMNYTEGLEPSISSTFRFWSPYKRRVYQLRHVFFNS